MSATKVSLIFNEQTINGAAQVERTAGWSESYYSVLGIENPSLITMINGLCTKRAGLLAKNCSIVGQRMQTVDPVGKSEALELKFPPGTGLDNDLPGIALRWMCDGASTPNRRPVILRGVPDSRISQGEYTPAAAFTSAVQAFFGELTGNWRFRAIDRTIQPVKIKSIVGGLMTTIEAHGLVAGDTVNIMTAVVSATFKKTSYQAKVLTRPSDTTVTLFPLGTLLECPDTVKGRMRKVAIIYPQMSIPANEIVTPKATHRDTGSPIGGFRGRRSTKR